MTYDDYPYLAKVLLLFTEQEFNLHYFPNNFDFAL